MQKFSWLIIGSVMFTACTLPTRESGFDTQNFDFASAPQTDFYQYVNGGWLKRTEIPADKSRYGAFTEIHDATQIQLRELVNDLSVKPNGVEQKKLSELYRSFMDETQIAALGLTPIASELNHIDKLTSHADVMEFMGHAQASGITVPISFWIDQDHKDTTRYQVYLNQAGLGLPDRDYYLDANFAEQRDAYKTYIAELGQLADLSLDAQAIFALETKLAQAHWSRVENRDRNATYNKYALNEFVETHGDVAWSEFFITSELAPRIQSLIVRQPSFVTELQTIIHATPVEVWQDYFLLHTLNRYAPYLTEDFVALNFAFYSKSLRGVEANLPRWKRGLKVLNQTMGEGLGKVYVERHFPPESKRRMDQLIENLRFAFKQSIDELAWMTPQTKQRAQQKLAKFTAKIGYPDQWREYTTLEIKADALIENLRAADAFNYQYELNKLGGPIKRDEWFMTPQTINAYYNPSMNEIVFPAAILQPPFFNRYADDAMNYGGIGAVIGHEFSHGFDDQGRKSDGDGNLVDWWTAEDAEQFTARTQKMVAQYNAYEPLPGLHINGELTLGENIADLAGLTMAYRAYLHSLNGQPAPIIDGFTGEQRFFMGWAQVWRTLTRDEVAKELLVTDPHSPPRYRVLGIVSNMKAFHQAFDIAPDDAMYRPPAERVEIW